VELKNVVNSGNEFYTYKTEDFVKIIINFTFFLPNNDYKTVLTASLLSEYLLKTNEIYKTYKEIEDKEKEYYDSYVDVYVDRYLNETFFSIEIGALDQTYIGDYYFNSFLDFAHDIVFKPNFKNNMLDKDIFKNMKKDRINELKIALANPKNLSQRILDNSVFPNTILSRGAFTNIEDYKKVINSITEEDIINLYNVIINENYYKGYAFGNLSTEDINKIKSLFTFKPTIRKPEYFKKVEIQSGEKEIVDNNYNESIVCVIYEIKNCDVSKRYLYGILSDMLNGTNGLCHEVLREELGICYHASASFYSTFGFFKITALISKENKEKCLTGIDEIINRLKDKNKTEELLNFTIEKQNQEDYLSEEYFGANINDLENYIFERRTSREEENKLINKLTFDDILNAINNIEKKYIFFFKGDKSEK